MNINKKYRRFIKAFIKSVKEMKMCKLNPKEVHINPLNPGCPPPSHPAPHPLPLPPPPLQPPNPPTFYLLRSWLTREKYLVSDLFKDKDFQIY